MTNTANTHHYGGATLAALFDSTHFLDGTMIVLKLRVWESNGGYYDGAIQAPAKNRVYALGNHTFSFSPFTDQILTDVQQAAQSMNYFIVTTQEDRKPSVISTIPAYTVFYAYSHGSISAFGDCFATSPILGLSTSGASNDYRIGLNDVKGAVIAKNLSQPPYNFEFLDCCNTAGDASLTPSPYWAVSFMNGSSSNIEDRAFLGWKNEVLGSQSNTFWTENVFNSLSQGLNLSDATLLATLQCPEADEFFLPAFPKIIGDTKMTLHTVYGGYGFDWGIEEWYRPL